MGNGSRQLNMSHTLTAHLFLSDLHAALFAYLVLVAYALIFTAQAFPVLGGSEDALAEQTVALCFERTVVYGFGLFDFAVGP